MFLYPLPEIPGTTYQSNMVFMLESSTNTTNESFSASVKFIQQVIANQPVKVEQGSMVSVVLCGNTSQVILTSNSSIGSVEVNTTQVILSQLGKLVRKDLGDFNLTTALSTATQLVSNINVSVTANVSGTHLPIQTDIVSVIESRIDSVEASAQNSVASMKRLGATMFAVCTNPGTPPLVLEALASQPSSSYAYTTSGYRQLSSLAVTVYTAMTPGMCLPTLEYYSTLRMFCLRNSTTVCILST